MWNRDFYPTPRHVIDQMIGSEDIAGKTILEPSAGKGNIVDLLNECGANVITCEKNPDLAKIAQGKSRFLKHDFLEVRADEISHIHAIIMNPPFSADEKHILHAWEIAPDGCTIVALCNWETVNNAYSRSRLILNRIITDYGHKDNLGPVFDNAERKTGANIGLIRLYKPASAGDFGDYFDSEEDDPEFEGNGIITYNAVREVVQRYVSAVRLYDQVVDNGIKMNELVGVFGIGNLSFTCKEGEKETAKQDFVKGLQKQAWNWIFSKMDMQKYMTESLRSDLNKFVEQQEKVPFTMKNIRKMILMVVGTHGQRMDKVLIEVFENITKHYSENRYAVEGWKTNSHYLLGEKFIAPRLTGTDWSGSGRPSIGYDQWSEKYEDLQKALCYLTGQNYDSMISLRQRVTHKWILTVDGEFDRDSEYKHFIPGTAFKTEEEAKAFIINNPDKGYGYAEPVEWGQWFDWNFFEVKLYKKGTGHFKFKDLDVWALFNQQVARIKGFPLPENVKRKAA